MTTPFISGITFIKDGLSLGYPIKESIESIEPLCDEVIINVGFGNEELTQDDGTYEYLRDHLTHPKFKFVKSYWSPLKREKGLILSEQTNIALSHAKGKYCQYIQGDEAIHEKDLSIIQKNILHLEKRKNLWGLVFNYIHFYGNTNIIKKTRNIYRQEVRVIRNDNVKSWLDAQGFRHLNDQKLLCKKIDASIFHYGWARKESVMKQKVNTMNQLYHGDKIKDAKFEYERIWGLKRFEKEHPSVMKEWINNNHNELDIMKLKLRKDPNIIGLALSDLFESLTGHRIGEYKNFKLTR